MNCYKAGRVKKVTTMKRVAYLLRGITSTPQMQRRSNRFRWILTMRGENVSK